MTLTDWYTSPLPEGCALLQPLKACEGVTLTGWCTSLLSVGCALLQPLRAYKGVTLTDRHMLSSPVGFTLAVRGRDAHRLAHVVVAGRLRPVTVTDGVRGRDAHRAPCHSH